MIKLFVQNSHLKKSILVLQLVHSLIKKKSNFSYSLSKIDDSNVTKIYIVFHTVCKNFVHVISEMGEEMLPCQRFSRDESTSFADKEREDGFGGGSTKGLWMCTRGN